MVIDTRALARAMKVLNTIVEDSETSPAVLVRHKDHVILAELWNVLWELQHRMLVEHEVTVTRGKAHHGKV